VNRGPLRGGSAIHSTATENHFFSALPRTSNNTLVAGLSGRTRSALILLWVVSWHRRPWRETVGLGRKRRTCRPVLSRNHRRPERGCPRGHGAGVEHLRWDDDGLTQSRRDKASVELRAWRRWLFLRRQQSNADLLRSLDRFDLVTPACTRQQTAVTRPGATGVPSCVNLNENVTDLLPTRSARTSISTTSSKRTGRRKSHTAYARGSPADPSPNALATAVDAPGCEEPAPQNMTKSYAA
jgi:hypothetical protein